MVHPKCFFMLAAATVAVLPTAGVAAAGTPLQQVLDAAGLAVEVAAREAHPNAEIDIRMLPLDNRLRLGPCEAMTSDVTGRRLHGRVSVKVRCQGPSGWGVFATAEVAVVKPVVITRGPVPRGTTLRPDDLMLVTRDISTLRPGYLVDLEDALEMTVRQGLRADAVVYARQLAAPTLVRRGDRVTISARHGAVEVSSQGIALSDGAYGTQIEVRNSNSDRTISGWVVGYGKISTSL